MRLVTVLYILIGGILIFGCSSELESESEEQRPIPAAAAFDADSTGEISATFRAAAEIISGQFQRDLKHTLTTAISEVGAAKAIGECKLSAPELAIMSDSLGWSIRRVSDKYRNPDNRADSSELALLARFKDLVDFEAAISFWSPKDSGWVYHFYEPIRTNKFCLNCHGDIQTLAKGVYSALKRDYPTDQATGYKAGEIRGMFIVEGVWPSGLAYATHLTDESAAASSQ